MDKYQGQQNEYVLLSLVRTRAVGHLRDVRRLVVAMSRARLGLYVFGRAPLFASCYELQPTFQCARLPAAHLNSFLGLHPLVCLKACSCLLSCSLLLLLTQVAMGTCSVACRHFMARPMQLALHPTGETYDSCSRPLEQVLT